MFILILLIIFVEQTQLHRDIKQVPIVIPVPYTRKCNSKEQVASLFLSMVSVFNGIKLGPRELEFLTFLVLREDGIMTGTAKSVYVERFKVSIGVVDNIIGTLKKKGVLVKQNDVTRIHPKIAIKFTGDNYIFQFKCQISNQN